MALTSVNPSPGSPMFKSEIRTSNFFVVMRLSASATLGALLTAKPSLARIADHDDLIIGSSSTNRIRFRSAICPLFDRNTMQNWPVKRYPNVGALSRFTDSLHACPTIVVAHHDEVSLSRLLPLS